MVALGALGMAVAWAGVSGPARTASASGGERPPSEAEVRETYLARCAICHGAEGRGTSTGPSLVGVGEASVHYYLSTGRMPLDDPGEIAERSAPAFEPAMISGLVDYVAEITGGGGPEIPEVGRGDAARGGEIYRLLCAACHAWSGDGGQLLDRAAPSVHPATPIQAAEAIRIGPGAMPSFVPAAMSDGEVDDVVAYLDHLDDTSDPGGFPLGHLGPLAEGAVAVVIGLGGLLVVSRLIGSRR